MVSCCDLRSFIIHRFKEPRQEFEVLKFLFRCLQLLVHSSSMIGSVVSFSFISYCNGFVIQQFNYLSPFFD